jgi:hypothetical protein
VEPRLAQLEGHQFKALAPVAVASPSAAPQGPELGPEVGPSLPPLHEAARAYDTDEIDDVDSNRPPLSPYSAERSLLHSLTLPSVPNTDIPPSPRGTPPPGLDALNKKFDTFLDLKRKQGTHFNGRLKGSAAARNPAMMDKLLRFVGIETDVPPPATDWIPYGSETTGPPEGNPEKEVWAGAAQYATTLAADLWDPSVFPGWTFKDALRKAQEQGQKERARKQGESVDFVPAGNGFVSAAASQSGSRAGTPGMASSSAQATGKRKSRFDA